MKRRALILLFALVLVRCNNDNITTVPVQPPTIASITPSHVSRAEHVVGTIQGSNFSGTQQVFLGNEVTVQKFTVLNPNTIEVEFIVNTNAAAGKRPVQVTTSAGTTSAPDLLEVLNNRTPIAKFDVAPKIGAPNTTYSFDALSTTDLDGTVVRYEWDFGDGKKGIGPIVKHKYGKVGTFDVTLSAIDNDEATGTATAPVNVKAGTAPTARFGINPQQGDINTTYTFNASNSMDPDGQIRQYLWTFGDGKTGTGMITTYHFPASGTYYVTLTVTDNDGLQNSVQKAVVVGAFDEGKAAQEIRDVVTEFFRRFEMLPTMSAEWIVVNWSQSPGCPGRAHEINIIEQQQQIIVKERVTILGSINVTFNSSARAHAIAAAQFDWTETDGSVHTGTASHDFTFIFESGKWQVCDFVVF